jgi:hypothetical protein
VILGPVGGVRWVTTRIEESYQFIQPSDYLLLLRFERPNIRAQGRKIALVFRFALCLCVPKLTQAKTEQKRQNRFSSHGRASFFSDLESLLRQT